ncbi:MAG: exodeoxyribonuclease V subunit gamma [Spirochaetes bacterium]|nr:exodeoxyribonuclease V subunit gamma [Spirochaetota bacterium]
MSIQLICATDTRKLIDHLVKSLRENGDSGPGIIRPILLPSVPLRERVRNEIARKLGVAMGIEFILPAKLAELVSQNLQLPPLDEGWGPDGLFWRVLVYLEKYAPPESRLKSLCEGDSSKVSLARAVADQFDQYRYFRGDLIRAWDEGKTYPALPEHAREDEKWQKEIWAWLLKEGGAVGRGEHAVRRADGLLEKLAGLQEPLFPGGLEVLATGPLSVSVLHLLKALGRSGEVRLRMLLPSLAGMSHPTGGSPDPVAKGHPLLESLGQQAMKNFRQFADSIAQGITVETLEDDAGGGDTLLGRLQREIRADLPPGPFPASLAVDRSLRIHRCHGPRRELEVLRDELLDAAGALPGLKAEEIMVLAPDLDAYGPLAAALLPGLAFEPGHIPMRLAEVSRGGRDSVLQGLEALVSFAAGRGPLSEGLALLDLPALRRRMGDEAAESLKEALRRAGITFGFDGAHRAKWGAGSFEVGTWKHGMNRLLSGFWFGDEAGAVAPGGAPYLPLSDALGTEASLEGALSIMKGILDTVARFGQPCTPEAWATRLEEASGAFFLADDGESEGGLPDLLGRLRKLRGEAAGRDFGLPVMRALLDGLAQDEERQVRKIGGQGAIGGLKPLRALPCRVLALVGLSDAAFPRRSAAPSWDLLAAAPQVGDRDPRLEDRELFLDSLLSVSDRLILTAPGRSVHTDKLEPMSVCLEELRRVCLAMGQRAGRDAKAIDGELLVDHPLQPFNPDNFNQAAYKSYQKVAFELGRKLQAGGGSRAPFAPGSPLGAAGLPDGEIPEISLAELVAFFKSPAKGFLGSLGIRLPWEDAAADEDQDPMELESGLGDWKLRDEIFRDLLEGGVPHHAERLMAGRLIPYGAWGQTLVAQRMADLQGLSDEVHNATGGVAPLRACQVRLPGALLTGEVRLSVDGKTFVMLTSSKWEKAAVQLEFFLHASFCAAAGVGEGALLACSQPEVLKCVSTALPSKQEAIERLSDFVSFYLENRGRLVAFAPETSSALLNLKDGQDPASVARAAWEGGYYPGEGSDGENLLAWRGSDPFDEARLPAWLGHAKRILAPAIAFAAPVIGNKPAQDPKAPPPKPEPAPKTAKAPPSKAAPRGRGTQK